MAYSLAQGDLIPFLGAGASAFAVAAETGKGLPRSALVPPRRTLLMDETEKRGPANPASRRGSSAGGWNRGSPPTAS